MTTIPKIEVLDLAGLCEANRPKPVEGIVTAVHDSHAFTIDELVVTEDGLALAYSKLRVNFVKGVTNDLEGSQQIGVTAISLIECVIQHLKAVNNGPLSNEDTSLAIEYFVNGQLRLINRAMDRQRRQVLFTSKP